jgi:hypothetical protein
METPNLVPWTVKSPSRSAICTVDYAINDPPTIYVIPVQVKSGNGTLDTLDHVRSQKLRRKVIDDVVPNTLKNLPNYAVHAWAGRDAAGQKSIPIDHILLLFGSDKSEDIKKTFADVKDKQPRSKVVKFCKDAEGKVTTEPIHCIMHPMEMTRVGQPLASAVDDGDYWRKLAIIIQQATRPTTMEDTTSSKISSFLIEAAAAVRTPPGIARELVLKALATPGLQTNLQQLLQYQVHVDGELTPKRPTFPKGVQGLGETKSKKQKNLMIVPDAPPSLASKLAKLTSADTVADTSKVAILLQTEFKLDPVLRMLHMELNLVPGIPASTRLSDLVLSVFGRSLVGPGIHQHLKVIRGMLISLEVSRNYKLLTSPTEPTIPAESAQDNFEVRAEHLQSGGHPNNPSPRSSRLYDTDSPSVPEAQTNLRVEADEACDFVVRDVQLARDVPRFIHASQYYSVARYFQEG